MVYKSGAKEVAEAPLVTDEGHGYVGDWLLDIANTPATDRLHTDRVIRSTRVTLVAQQAATTGAQNVSL